MRATALKSIYSRYQYPETLLVYPKNSTNSERPIASFTPSAGNPATMQGKDEQERRCEQYRLHCGRADGDTDQKRDTYQQNQVPDRIAEYHQATTVRFSRVGEPCRSPWPIDGDGASSNRQREIRITPLAPFVAYKNHFLETAVCDRYVRTTASSVGPIASSRLQDAV